ncbi:MAG: sodium:proton antiporter [Desulforegulaceae bacterium]|nr:sodium:proton antiporter [Desulforegulaceae bacterium]
MFQDIFLNPGLTIGLALVAGILSQILSHHMKIPGIVILLFSGVILGPDVFGIVRPESLGKGLTIITGFAVAVILFEGGMNLKFSRLKREQKSIRFLLLSGCITTACAGSVAAKYIMNWPWQTAVLFGTLVIVTGPTVINPLLKRIKVKRSVATLLEAEGILIDAIGAVIAIVAFEAAMQSFSGSPGIWILGIASRIGIGSFAGAVSGFVFVYIFKKKNLIPEGMENVFILCMILFLFQATNAFLSESGLAAVTIAGIIMGNYSTHVQHNLTEFKEEITIMLIGMLFVLLSADVRIESIINLGIPGVITVMFLIFIVRPLAVFAGTAFSEFNIKEKIFISWIGPRGIVAAAIASFFAAEMSHAGISGGIELRALVFLVIAITVIWAGLTGETAAALLGLKRSSGIGWVILGANETARSMAKILKESGQEVVCIDSNADHCKEAEKDCTKVIYGNGLQSRYLKRAEIEMRLGAIALTGNEEVNYMFIQNVRANVKNIGLYSAMKKATSSLTENMLYNSKTKLLFAKPLDIVLWSGRFKKQQVRLQLWKNMDGKEIKASNFAKNAPETMFFAAISKKGKIIPFGNEMSIKENNEVFVFVFEKGIEPAIEFMENSGFQRMTKEREELFSTSICQI